MDLYMRRATMEDALDILRWRNDEDSRNSSFNKKVIPLPEHMEWFKKKLADPDCCMQILMAGEEKAGYTRIDCHGDVGEISTIIAPEMRGKGYGKEIFALTEEGLPEKVKVIVAFALESNEGSRRCMLENGYTELVADKLFCYVKRLR